MKLDRTSDLPNSAQRTEVSHASETAQAQAAATSEPQTGERDSFLWFYVTIAGSLLLRVSVLDFESGDYRLFLGKWYDFFVEHGRWRGLGEITEAFSSYPSLYLYLVSLSTLLPLPKLYAIKLISIAA